MERLIFKILADSCSLVLGIYDGHRGSETAQFASEEISDILANCIMDLDDPGLAFKQAYLQLESKFEASGLSSFPDPKGTRYPGCTALSALIWQDELFLANSGAVLVIGQFKKNTPPGFVQTNTVGVA